MGLNELLVDQMDVTGPSGLDGETPQDSNVTGHSGDATARRLYGYVIRAGGYLPEGPVLTDVAGTREINTTATGKTVGGMNLAHHSLGVHNPMFWLLILGLIIVGYLGFLFDVDVKKVGQVKFKGGER